MPSLVEVAFKGNRKEFFLWEGDEPLPARATVIVEADRGEDIGVVYATGELAEKRAKGVPHAPTPEEPVSRLVQRLATPDEIKRARELREQDETTRRKAMERVKANGLVMKLTDAEWRWDRRKLTIFFSAEKRVDFRNLVRELAATFRTRIELKQIGVRDEARRLDGIGRCGRQYCSASWLPELRPVSLGVAKDQRLSLNPTQISGACGRLMCSLRYEHEFYVQARRRFPKEGKNVRTAAGEERVVANDIFRERVVLRNAEGENRTVALTELLREIEAAGGSMTPAVPDRPERGERPARLEWTRGEAPAADEAGETLEEAEEQQDAAPPPARPPDGVAAVEGGAEKRPHRRRGRRGGRRNRGRRANGGADGGANADSGANSDADGGAKGGGATK